MRRGGSRTIHQPDQLPLFTPNSSWVAPTELPDLRGVRYLSVDVESHDPHLQELGPGYIRGDAHVCGVAFATEAGHRLYLPYGHSEDNLDRDKVINYVAYQLGRTDLQPIAANAMYEYEALWSMGIKPARDIIDVQVAEPLLDEERPGGYSLDSLSNGYLGHGKDETLLKEAVATYGYSIKDRKKVMAKLPARYVGPYAEADAVDTLGVFLQQVDRLQTEELNDIFGLETELTRVLFGMRLMGVRVDLDRAEALDRSLGPEEDGLLKTIRELAGWRVNPNSADDLANYYSEKGIMFDYTRSKNPKPSFTSDWFKIQHDPFSAAVLDYRQLTKMRKDFIRGSILAHNINGRLHTNWHQLREMDEDGASKGTRTGRVASSKPNLTQIPARHPRYGKMIRSIFVADHGKVWTKYDYSQQEPRILLHYAVLMGFPGAEEARRQYTDDPNTDYHQLVADLIKERAGKDIGRRAAKDINLGGAYGMGRDKLVAKLNVPPELAMEILKAYHAGVPYVKKLEGACTHRANQVGFIRTILGRKRRFPLFEPKYYPKDHPRYRPGLDRRPTRDYNTAVHKWGAEDIQRADARKALNALVQGSAADQMKQTLVLLHREGLSPNIQVYDEIDGNYDQDPRVLRRVKEVMESAIETTVPFLVQPDVGPNWGELKEHVL